MTDTLTPVVEPPVPTYDVERLAKAKYLSGPEAAFYLGYTPDRYKTPYSAFWALVARNPAIKPGHIGRRLFFDRAKLDQLLTRG